MGLKNVFDRMFLKHFMCTVYQAFHDDCLKNISVKTLISSTKKFLNMFPVKPIFLSYFINV